MAAQFGAAILGHHLLDLGGGGGLQPHVEFQLKCAGDGLDEGLGLEAARQGHEPVCHPRGQSHGVQTLGHLALHAGSQDLDRDLAPVGQKGRMGLGQGGGGDGRAEVAEQALDRTAQRPLDLAPGLIQRKRRQVVLQPAQVARELHTEDVGPRGQHLTQFDGDRSQVFEGATQALARPSIAAFASGEHVQKMGDPAHPGRQQGRDLARDQGVMADQNRQPAQQAEGRFHRMPHRLSGRGGRRGGGVDAAGQIAHP